MTFELDDDYRPAPPLLVDWCDVCGRLLPECNCDVYEDLRLDAEWEALMKATQPNLGPS